MAAGHKTGGRQAGTPNKATAELKELARQYTTEALEALLSVLRSDAGPAKVAAAREILDRGYGKAAQAIEHSTDEETVKTLAGLGVFKWQTPQ